jgi:hypothetical protein
VQKNEIDYQEESIVADSPTYIVRVEWAGTAPQLTGFGTTLSPQETLDLLIVWTSWIWKFLDKQDTGDKTPEHRFREANVTATIRAFGEVHGRVPDEEEMQAGQSELSKKLDLFHAFVEKVYINLVIERLLSKE